MITPRSPIQVHPYRPLELMFLGLVAAGVSLLVFRGVYEGQPVSVEGGRALFQAWNFLDGRVTRDVSPFEELMRVEGILTLDGGRQLPYDPPGHALWRLPGVWGGFPVVMSALGAAITCMCAYEVGRLLRVPRFLLPVLVLMSPFFLLMQGTLTGRSAAMAFSGLMLLCYVAWRQDRGVLAGMGAGLCWGVLFLLRPQSALLLGIPFLVDGVVEGGRGRGGLRLWAGTVLFLLAAGMGVGAWCVYNEWATGDPWLSPAALYWAEVPHPDVGGRMFRFFRHGVRDLDQWMLGTPPFTLLVWLGLTAHGWSRRWSGLLLGAVAAVWFGHAAFPPTDLQFPGPAQHAEIFPHLLLLGTLGLSRIWRRSARYARFRAVLFGVFVVAVAGFSFVFLIHEREEIRLDRERGWALNRAVEGLPSPALLFLPERSAEEWPPGAAVSLNVRGRESPILRLGAREEDRAAIAAGMPARRAYVLRLEGETEIEVFEEPFENPELPGVGGQYAADSGRDVEGVRVATAGSERAGLMFHGWKPFLPPGRYEIRFDMRWRGVEADAPVRIEVVSVPGERRLDVRELSGGLDRASLHVDLRETDRLEPRVHFGGGGSVELRRISLRRLGPLHTPIP